MLIATGLDCRVDGKRGDNRAKTIAAGDQAYS